MYNRLTLQIMSFLMQLSFHENYSTLAIDHCFSAVVALLIFCIPPENTI